jgi:siroheme synthase-like protein
MSFPLALDLSGRLCLVVGGSAEALARVQRFVRAGADVRWVTGGSAAGLDPGERDGVTVHTRSWQSSDLDDVWLVVFADRDAATAKALRAACDQRQRFFCAIDQTEWNTYNHVAIVEQGPVQIAISTGGKAPALAKRLRRELERLLEDGQFAAFAERVARAREQATAGTRQQVMDALLDGFAIEGQLLLPPDDGSG